MSHIALTNNLHHQAIELLKLLSDDSHKQAPLELAFLLVFERLLCALAVESGDLDKGHVAQLNLAMLLSQEHPTWLVRQLSLLSSEPGSWLREFRSSLNDVLSPSVVKPVAENDLILVTSVSDSNQAYQRWLSEFEQLMQTVRELNQEY